MAKLRYLLKEPQSKDKTLVIAVYRIGNSRVVRSTKELVAPSDWDSREQLPKASRNRGDMAELRAYLSSLRLEIETSLISLRREKKEFTVENIGAIMDAALGNTNRQASIPVREFVKEVMIQGKKQDTIKLMRYFVDSLESYRKGITTASMNTATFSGYASHLINKGLAQNTVRNYLSAFKRVARQIEIKYDLKDLHIDNMKPPGYEKAHRLVLSIDELLQLYRFEGYNKETREAMDFFIVMCFTGVRKKDAFKSGDVNFADGEFYVIDTSKRGNRVIVPQHYIIREIIQKYGGLVVPKLQSLALMKRIRTGAEQAGLTDEYFYTITIGSYRKVHTVRKCDAISYHTARRSFATNLHKSGIPVKVAMMFTGHKTVQQYMDYIMIDEKDNANEYAGHEFFINSPEKSHK